MTQHRISFKIQIMESRTNIAGYPQITKLVTEQLFLKRNLDVSGSNF